MFIGVVGLVADFESRLIHSRTRDAEAVSVSVDGHEERRVTCRYSRLVVRLIYAGWLPQDDCSAGTVLLL